MAGFLDRRLDVKRYDEPDSNQLIVRAADTVSRVAAAVSTTFHAIDEASRLGADLLVVHHRSWPEIDLGLVEEKHRRLRERGRGVRPSAAGSPWRPGRRLPEQRALRQGRDRAGGAPYTTMVEAGVALGADTYLTGEGSMYTRKRSASQISRGAPDEAR